MQNIKNFRPYTPSKKLRQKYAGSDDNVILFLRSEDKRDWYECQSDFDDNTIKLMYDADGIIRSVVDSPVVSRGNTLAVSMLWPVGMSVAEVACLPEGFVIDGVWKYSDGIISRDTAVIVARNHRLLVSKMAAAAAYSWLYDNSAPRDGDDKRIEALHAYADKLRDVVITDPVWPTLPACMTE